MQTRREVLKSGAALAASLGMLRLSSSRAYSNRPVIAVVDPHFSASAAFIRETHAHGVRLLSLTSDVGNVWLQVMDDCAGARAPYLIGFTAEQSLFCLDQMTRSHGLRIVHRLDHAPQLDTAGGREAARRALRSSEHPLTALPLAPGPTLGADGYTAVVLSSWVIAPLGRSGLL